MKAGTANNTAPVINMMVRIWILKSLARKKINCCIVLINQNRLLPPRKTFPNEVEASSPGKKKQTKAANTK
ncbi:hypothetical protein BH20BAC1_BH20BAC1_02730 [soil metagenome]